MSPRPTMEETQGKINQYFDEQIKQVRERTALAAKIALERVELRGMLLTDTRANQPCEV